MREMQEQFLRDIYSPQIPDNPEIALYRELTRTTLQDSLETLFPITKSAYEATAREKSWDEIGDNYISLHWPKDIRLFWAFEEFPNWLPTESWIKYLADYEWARYLVTIGDEGTPDAWLNPTVILRCYPFAIPQWFLEREQNLTPIKGGLPIPSSTTTRVALFREIKTDHVRVLDLHEAAFELLSYWIQGETPMSSAQSLSDQLDLPVDKILNQFEPLLKTLAQEGVLLSLSRKNTR